MQRALGLLAARRVARAEQRGDATLAEQLGGGEADALVGPGDQCGSRRHAGQLAAGSRPAGETGAGWDRQYHLRGPGPARDRAGWIHGRAGREAGHPAGGAGRVPARAAVPAAAGRGGAARRRAAAHPGAAPPGGGRAGRDVGGLLHPAGAGPRAAPVGADPGRAGPGADADPGRAGLPVPDGRGEPAAGRERGPEAGPGHPAPAGQPGRHARLRAGRPVRRAGLEPAGYPLHRRHVRGPGSGPERAALDVPAARRRSTVERRGHAGVRPQLGRGPARGIRPLPG